MAGASKNERRRTGARKKGLDKTGRASMAPLLARATIVLPLQAAVSSLRSSFAAATMFDSAAAAAGYSRE
jgi:hypothetical protein